MAKETVEKTSESAERIAFKKIIEAYAKQNPKKYEIKKAELEKKLAAKK